MGTSVNPDLISRENPLGLEPMTLEEEAEWNRRNNVLDLTQTGSDEVQAIPEGYVFVPELFREKRSPYHHELFPGVWIDVYAVLNTFPVKDQLHGHLIKKALQPGQRGDGHKSEETDYREIVWSAKEAYAHYQLRQLKEATHG